MMKQVLLIIFQDKRERNETVMNHSHDAGRNIARIDYDCLNNPVRAQCHIRNNLERESGI